MKDGLIALPSRTRNKAHVLLLKRSNCCAAQIQKNEAKRIVGFGSWYDPGAWNANKDAEIWTVPFAYALGHPVDGAASTASEAT